jgi:hypothetical protein
MMSKQASNSSLTLIKTDDSNYESEDILREKLEVTKMKLIVPKTCEPDDIIYTFRNCIK